MRFPVKDIPTETSFIRRSVYRHFGGFIDCIKSYDDSVYFWIQGGILRRAFRSTFKKGFDSLQDGGTQMDIDIFTKTIGDYIKLKDILIDKMGFTIIADVHVVCKLRLFNIKIDLCKPADINLDFDDFLDLFDMEDGRHFQFWNKLYTRFLFQSVESSVYWADFTNSAMALDSEYNLYYHEYAFESIIGDHLNFVKRDDNLIENLIDKYCDVHYIHIMRLIFGTIRIRCHYVNQFRVSNPSTDIPNKDKPRVHKFLDIGYSITDEEWENNEKLLEDIANSVLPYLTTIEDRGWWQNSAWVGIINYELTILDLSAAAHEIIFEQFNTILDKLLKKDLNIVKKLNLKEGY